MSVLVTVWACLNPYAFMPAQRVIHIFENDQYGTTEADITDPLTLAGDKVLPLLVNEIQKRQMRRRLDGIAHLGNQRYKPALAVLTSIVNSETEEQVERVNALVALYKIDPAQGEACALSLMDKDTLVGSMARDIIEGRYKPRSPKTYWSALHVRLCYLIDTLGWGR